MTKKQLRRGGIYAVKVSGAVVPCRLISGYADDGTPAGAGPWECKNIITGRRVIVRGAARFRYELEPTTREELERQPGREYKPKTGTYAAWSEETARTA
jgi:hypothetical protein